MEPGTEPTQQGVRVAVSPASATVRSGETVGFEATVTGTETLQVSWEVEEGSAGGAVTADGIYSAPSREGTFHVRAVSVADPTKMARAAVTVKAPSTDEPPPPASPSIPPGTFAFPGCEGSGCGSAGGRGGTVHKVTSLADSGPGTLRACVQASGPRTCLFTVGGTIGLRSELNVNNPYLTIAGQTAPGGGVQLVGLFRGSYMFSVRTHDVTVRYVRFFNDANPPCDASSQGCGLVRVLPPAKQVVLDHVTVGYTQDESFSVFASAPPAPTNVTVSWMAALYPLADHPVGVSISGKDPATTTSMTDIDLHHNYFANLSHRLFSGGAKRARWAYNIVFNYQWYATRTGMGVVHDFVGNIYRCGNQSTCTRYPLTLGEWEHDWPAGTPSIYFHNNVWKDAAGRVKTAGDLSDADQWASMVYMVANSSVSADSRTPAPASYRRGAPMPAPATGSSIANGPAGPLSSFVVAADGSNLERAMLDAGAAGDSVRGTPYGPVGASRRLDCDGNLVDNVDGLLQRVYTEYLGGGNAAYAPPGGAKAPVRQTDICWAAGQCGIPSLAAGVACADADGDGMPDPWEARWGLDGRSAAGDDGANGKKLSAAYTNLELYLSGFMGF
jgi:hypothetical protein